MRDTVLYVGGFGLPDRSASALRALGNAAAFREAGFRVVIAGKFQSIPDAGSQPIGLHGFDCYDIRQPLPTLTRVDYTVSPANLRALAEEIGAGRLRAIMAYNYPGFGLSRLIGLGKSLGVPVINESTEWYGWEGVRPVTNLRRILESGWRNNSLVERAGNFVCATRWSRDRHPGANVLVLPFVLDPSWECWQVAPESGWVGEATGVRLVYSGSPGLGMHKDRLPLIIEALDRIDPDGQRFRFAVVGITQAGYLQAVPRHSDLLARQRSSIRFMGRISHREAVSVLKAADFSVFVRDDNRVSRVGFPTKYAEAATCGVPVLTNRSSDIGDYLVDGDNGILITDCSRVEIEAGLRRALLMPREKVDAMRQRVREQRSFTPRTWAPKIREFMSQLRLPR